MFRAALFVIAREEKQHKCPSTDGWTNKVCNISTYTYNEVLFGHKKE